jgi:hypothetical protein
MHFSELRQAISLGRVPLHLLSLVTIPTATTHFVDDILRHIVNRRMRWSYVHPFVRTAVDMLRNSFQYGSSQLTLDLATDLVCTVHQLVNSRPKWRGAGGARETLLLMTEHYVTSIFLDKPR